MAFQGILCALPLFCGQDCPSCRLKLCPCAVSTARGLFVHKILCTSVFADQPIPGASRESSPVSLYVGCAPWCRVASAGGSAGARSAFHRRAARRKSTATANAPNADEQKRGGGRRGTRAARKKAAASALANKDARAGTTKAADDGTPATLPPHERDTAGGLAAALATAERERTTGTRKAACLIAAPPTREPTVETMDARPKRETRPTGTRTPIAGREARMHERKTLAGQGGHAPPGTSTALKRRLYLGRPEKGASAEWETRLGRWKQRQSAVAPAASAEKAHRQGATAGGRAQLARSGGLRRSRLRNARGSAPTASTQGGTHRARARANSPRSADDKPAAQKPVAPAASAERRGGRHSSATAAGCARKGRGRGQSVKPTRARHVIFRVATSRSGFDARYTHKRGDALNAARRCGRL